MDLELCAALRTACSLAGPGVLGVTGRTVSEVRTRKARDIDKCTDGVMAEEK